MNRFATSISIVIVTGVIAACGGGQTKEEQAAKVAETAANAFTQAAKDAAAGKAPAVTVVPFEKLMPFLPEMPGWEQSEPKGDTSTAMGVTVSQVHADYGKDDSNIRIEIMDSSLNETVLRPFMMMAREGYMERRSDGYTKATTIGGNPAVEEWNTDKNGEINVMLANRFMVKVSGQEIADIEVVRRAFQTINLSGIAALK